MKGFSIVGILVGIASVLIGITILLNVSSGKFDVPFTNYYEFGADYYTEQYTATVHIANGVEDFLWWFGIVTGLFFSVFGGADICYFGCKFCESKKKELSPVPIVIHEEKKIDRTPEYSDELPDL